MTKERSGDEVVSEARKSKGQLLSEGGDARRRIAYLEAAGKLEDRALERLFGLSLDMMCIIGFDGYFKLLNPAWERALGWTKQDLLGRPYAEFVHPEDREESLTKALSVSTGENSIHFESRCLCKDGSYRWLSWQSTASLDQGLVYAVARDVTDERQLRERLQAVSDYTRSLIEASPDPLATIAPGGKITDVNSAMERVTGRPRKKLIGTDFSACFSEPDQARTGHEQAFRDGQVTNYPLEMLHRDGHVTPVLYNASV